MFKARKRQSEGNEKNSWLSLASAKQFLYFQRTEAFHYDVLPPNEDYIRYLLLDPGKGNEPLVCRLRAAALTELPSFEAISYTCGSNKKTVQILCAGKTIPITANLRDALRRIRLPQSPKTLWADAICISQDDEEERSNQITLMEHIYRKADKTLIYLGPDHGEGQDVSSLFAEIVQLTNDQMEESGSWDQMPALDPDHHLAKDER
jgi:hypothetical protein